jgi:HK97 family phage major capsid protein
MNIRIKQLQEKLAAKRTEAEGILKPSRDETRALKTEEFEKLGAIETEIRDLEKTIDAEVRIFTAAAQRSPADSLSRAEKRDLDQFNWADFVRGLDKGGRFEGLEAEMVAEGERDAQEARIVTRGVTLPRVLLQRRGVERRDMTATGGTSYKEGGYLIPTEKMGILDDLYNAMVLREAGAQFLTGVVGNFDWPRYTAPSAWAHKSENEAAAESTATVSGVSFAPNRLPTYVDISDQLMIQTSNVIETIVRRNLLEQAGALMEYFAIHGTNSNNQPYGIVATTGIGSVAGGTNGAAPTWTHIVALESKVAQNNAARGSLHYLSNQWVKGQLKTTAKVSSSDSRMVLDDINGGLLNGYVPLWSNNVSHTLAKGSSGSVCSAIIFGQFSDLVIATWSGISFEMVRDVTYANAGKRALVMSLYYDSNVIRPVSFAAMLDATTGNVN